jgi:DNA-binding response OmpR family regulator
MHSLGSSASAAQLHRMLEVLSIAPEAMFELQGQKAHWAAELRALSREAVPADRSETLNLGELSVDLAGHEVRVGERKVHLTHREFALLAFLALRRGRVCKRSELVTALWANRSLRSDRTLDIHVYRLRTKLPGLAPLIETVPNVGYVLRTPEDVTTAQEPEAESAQR